jgi:hypothetical protein
VCSLLFQFIMVVLWALIILDDIMWNVIYIKEMVYD